MRRLKYRRPPLERHLTSFHEGETSFDDFVRATAGDWKRLATYLRNRWAVPMAVEVADVEQEMLLAAWKAVSQWDAQRGVSLRSYVLWTAITASKKWIHNQRSALRRDDRAPSRHDLTMGEVRRADTVDFETNGVEPTQEAMVSGRESFERVLAAAPLIEQICLRALVASGGDVAGAAISVQGDLRLRDAREARCVIAKTVSKFVDAMSTAE